MGASVSPVPPKGEKIPALDGLRGLSISLVLLAHLSGTRDLATGVRLYDLDSLGNLGVRIFFVISGFLLWQEPFLNRFSRSEVTQFPVNLLLAFAAASASHYLVERPLLRWRQRLRRG